MMEATLQQIDGDGGLSSKLGDLSVTLSLFVFSLYIHWPGFMTSDSISQLLDAESALYRNWYPPLMSFWWRQINRLYFGPGSMLVFNHFLFFTGLFLLFRSIFSDPKIRRG